MLFTVAPPACVAKYSTNKNTEIQTYTHTHFTEMATVFKEYALIKEMSRRPLNMESIGPKMFILSQLYW